MTERRSKSFAILSLALLSACAPAMAGSVRSATPGTDTPRNIILMVADGAGVAYWSAARIAQDSLAVAQMPVVGLVDTRGSEWPRITDSAAGATAYANATRTFNGALGVGPRCQELMKQDSAAVMRDPAACDPKESIFDIARARGKSVGVVTTTHVTDATPAAFLSHVPTRKMETEIAAQQLAKTPDVILGGGAKFFGPERADGRNLLADYCARAVCLSSAEQLASYVPDDRPLLGLFASSWLEAAPNRKPALDEMARVALTKLSRNPRGFMVMIESEGTDDAGHANESLESIAAEALALDRAVGVALDFARRTPGTLVIVVADHETGGLSIVNTREGGLAALYTTKGHTAEMVPLFAFGPGAERFGGIQDNYRVGQKLQELMRR
jgi:alkaline phosphatase